MHLIATTRPEPVALATGAYLIDGGTRLRCPLLLIEAGNKRREVTLRDLFTKERIRVRLPAEAIGQSEHLRFELETLEVIS